MLRFNKPSIGKKDLESVLYCMITDDLSPGEHMRTFASMLARELNLPHVIAFHAYVQAFETIFRLIGADRGDEAILCSLSRYAVLSALQGLGIIPVLVDLEEDSLLPSYEQIEKKISARAKCIIVSQLFGIPHDLTRYRDFGLTVIEDLDGSLGSSVGGVPIGRFGTFVTMSLNDSSVITAAGGGLLASGEKTLGKLFNSMKNAQGGLDYLMSDFNASLGISQLSKLKSTMEVRRKIGEYYDEAVMSSGCTLIGRGEGVELSYSSYVVRTETPFEECARFFKRHEIPIRKGLEKPLHAYLNIDVRDYPRSEEMCNKLVAFPIYPGLSKEDIEKIAKCIRTIL